LPVRGRCDMPIYCFKCDDCGAEREHFARAEDAADTLRCPRCTSLMMRNFSAELPVMNTADGAGVGGHGTTGVMDTGAGEYFEDGVLGRRYRQWAKDNKKYGVTPEPMKRGEIEESIHRSRKKMTRAEKSPMNDKEHKGAWRRAYHEAKAEQQVENRIIINASRKTKKKVAETT